VHNFGICKHNGGIMIPTYLQTHYVFANIMVALCFRRIGRFRQILRPNTFYNLKSPPRSGILFASTEVVRRPRSDSPLHFDIVNISQIRIEKSNASARCLLPADMLERWPQGSASRSRLQYYRQIILFPQKQI